jgi:GDP-4-dehydro-6-deoxy-D-mannose reductase
VSTFSKKILITGASGFTGYHACQHFLKAGYEVTAIVRNHPLDLPIHIEKCDLSNYDSVLKLIKKVQPEFVLHLAGQNHVGNSWKDPVGTINDNFISTLHLVEALRTEVPLCNAVIVGSALEFTPSNPYSLPHPYSFSKTIQILVAKAWAVLFNLNIKIAKPTNLIGPGVSNGVCSVFSKKIVEMENDETDRTLEVNNLKTRRDFIDVRDAVKAYELILTTGESNEVYEVNTGKLYTLEDIVLILKNLTPIQFECKELGFDITNKESEIMSSNEKLKKLGWKPTIQLEESLQDILNFHRNKNV